MMPLRVHPKDRLMQFPVPSLKWTVMMPVEKGSGIETHAPRIDCPG